MASQITEIILPTRPQPDTLVAIFLLQNFGKEIYPGIETATLTIDPKATEGEGKILIDVGGGEFDHHGTDLCATELIAKKLDLIKKPDFRNLIAYARRDDTEGKGTVSRDPIDRAFGLSGLVHGLNKKYKDEPQKIVDMILPLLSAHYDAAHEYHVILPKTVAGLKQAKLFSTEVIHVPFRNCKVAFITSNAVGLAGYLRSNPGGCYNVIVQRRSSGHVNILTRATPKIQLARTAAMIRMYEAQLQDTVIKEDDNLFETGTHELIPNWYYDPATNSILNGGVTPDSIPATKIPWNEFQAIVLHALQTKK